MLPERGEQELAMELNFAYLQQHTEMKKQDGTVVRPFGNSPSKVDVTFRKNASSDPGFSDLIAQSICGAQCK